MDLIKFLYFLASGFLVLSILFAGAHILVNNETMYAAENYLSGQLSSFSNWAFMSAGEARGAIVGAQFSNMLHFIAIGFALFLTLILALVFHFKKEWFWKKILIVTFSIIYALSVIVFSFLLYLAGA